MTYDEMMSELRTAGTATRDGVEALAPMLPRVARSGLRNDVPEHLRSKPVPLTAEILKSLMSAIAPVVNAHVEQRIAEAVRPLEQRIVDLESKPSPRWRGAFVEGQAYNELSFVVCSGALWIAERQTSQRPGSDNSGWRLCVKRGHANA